MGDQFDFLSTVLRGRRKSGVLAGTDQPMALNERNAMFVQQDLPINVENVRLGERWKVTTATPFAPQVALPTTVSKLEIKNGTTARMMVVDTIYAWQLLGTAVVWQITPWAQVGAAVQATVTALVVYSANGQPSYASALGRPAITSIDDTVVAAGWEAFPGSTTSWGLAAATPGGANIGDVAGRLIVPPGKALHLTVTGSVATASSCHVGASFYWADLSNVGA